MVRQSDKPDDVFTWLLSLTQLDGFNCVCARGGDPASAADVNFMLPKPEQVAIDEPVAVARISVSDMDRKAATTAAATWIGAVTKTEVPPRLQSDTVTADETDAELHAWLQNGDLLIAVVNRVRPGSVRQQRSSRASIDATGMTSPFKIMTSITNYVQACRELGVPSQDLFEASELSQAFLFIGKLLMKVESEVSM